MINWGKLVSRREAAGRTRLHEVPGQGLLAGQLGGVHDDVRVHGSPSLHQGSQHLLLCSGSKVAQHLLGLQAALEA